ncbi:exosortase A-associated hydrolase 2 [Rhodothalassium salexigens DSM 2132]|uniref:Exosortase A-associated hydrolase 2 n=1 Tax=Rhodothalassium salexigens DSM 2132 TaxID=1188247 RepID=A0A4R2PCK6_RHOSA|nr:hydrolase 2, exosortase A system-associated [Rhodothalassium salexigens]MBB4212032.1 exosortase A-associated hydrolase 2 [Rhodothalassium salexigens DSM 2132]TCP32909.1 exosortase A-associated hydrolase 2 [Rhodothalassium salexigens DSM 2132]
MVPDAEVDFAAGYIGGANGPLFVVQVGRADPGRLSVLLLPPFAEEMNCSRRFLVGLARRLSAVGCCVFLLDYYGTGDSGGRFADATPDRWRGDVAAVHDRLTAHFDRPPAWVGVRLGASLGALSASTVARPPSALVLIQPVTSGRSFLTQFLRLGLVSALAGGRREGPKDLLARSVAGETVRVAGYDLAPAMVSALQALDLATAMPPPATRLVWYELVRDIAADPPRRLRPPSAWGAAAPIERLLESEPFWSIQEPQVPATVLDAVCEDLAALDRSWVGR